MLKMFLKFSENVLEFPQMFPEFSQFPNTQSAELWLAATATFNLAIQKQRHLALKIFWGVTEKLKDS